MGKQRSEDSLFAIIRLWFIVVFHDRNVVFCILLYVICSFCKLFRSFRFSQAEVSNVRIPTKAQNPLLFGCALRLRLICIFTAEDDVTYYAAQCHHSSYGSRVMEWYVEGSLSTIGSPPSHAPSSIAKVKRQLHHGTSHQLTTLAETQQLLLWRRHGEEAAARTVPPHAPLVSPQRKSSPVPNGSPIPPYGTDIWWTLACLCCDYYRRKMLFVPLGLIVCIAEQLKKIKSQKYNK